MAINLPSNPTIGDTFSSPSGILYEWSGTAWNVAEITDYPYVTQPTKTRVNAGQEVQFYDFAFRIPTSGNRSLQVRRLAGVPGNIIGCSNYINISGVGGAQFVNQPLYNIGITFSYFVNWTFGNIGDMQEVVFQDMITNYQYRVTLIIGSGYNDNTIVPQLLYKP